MTSRPLLLIGLTGLATVSAFGADAQRVPGSIPLAQRIAHTAPETFRPLTAVHGGAGSMNFGVLLGADALSTNLIFLHRGVIQPRSGIGQHFHNQCEEMFVIFEGEAQFTVDGRTSLLKAPAGAPVRMNH